MADYYARIKDVWRPLTYRKAIGTIKKKTAKITTYDEAIQLQWIGHRLAEKIQEIGLTNRLRRLDNAKLEPMILSYRHFSRCMTLASTRYIKGFKQATKLSMTSGLMAS
jgi:DNA polymerase IV